MKNSKFSASRLILLLAACLFLLTGVNPALAQSEGPDADAISDEVGLVLDAISVSENGIEITVALPPDLDQETFFERLFAAMERTRLTAPQAAQVTVHITYLDQPYGQLQAAADDVRQTAMGELDGAAFLARVDFQDLRPPEVLLWDELSDIGIEPFELRVTDTEFFLSYFSDVYAEKMDVFDQWVMVLNLIANLYPDVAETTLMIIVPDNQTELTLQVAMSDYARYQREEINLLEFIARVETSYGYPDLPEQAEDPAPQPAPLVSDKALGTVVCSSLFFLLSITAIAAGAFLILTKKSVRWGIVVLVIVALPSCLAGAAFVGIYFMA